MSDCCIRGALLFVWKQLANPDSRDHPQSALLSVLSGTLLVFTKSDSSALQQASPRGHTFLTLVSYGAIIFNTSATIGSLALTDKLGDLPAVASQNPDLEKSGSTTNSPALLMSRFGLGSSFNYAMWHCESWGSVIWTDWLKILMNPGLFCLLAGFWCIMLEILVYIFLQESTAAKITITCLVGFAMLPLLFLVISPSPQKPWNAVVKTYFSKLSPCTMCKGSPAQVII